MEKSRTVRELCDAFIKRLRAINYRVADRGDLQYRVSKDTSNDVALVSIFYYNGWKVNVIALDGSDISKRFFTDTISFRNNKDLAKLVSLVDQHFTL